MIHLEFQDPQNLQFIRIPEAPKPSKPDFCRGNWLPKGTPQWIIGVDMGKEDSVGVLYDRVKGEIYELTGVTPEMLASKHSGERARDGQWIAHDGDQNLPVPIGTKVEYKDGGRGIHTWVKTHDHGCSCVTFYRIVKP